MFEFIGNEFESGENKFERERVTIIFSIRQYPVNSVIIFWKRHNILERCFFVWENTLKSDFIFLLQREQRGYVYVFMFFLAVHRFFLLDRFARKTDWHILFQSMFSMFSMYLGMPKVAYLFVGQGLHIVPIASTLKVLITPPRQHFHTNMRAPSCRATPNQYGTILISYGDHTFSLTYKPS
jgi:hypothetical protein